MAMTSAEKQKRHRAKINKDRRYQAKDIWAKKAHMKEVVKAANKKRDQLEKGEQ